MAAEVSSGNLLSRFKQLRAWQEQQKNIIQKQYTTQQELLQNQQKQLDGLKVNYEQSVLLPDNVTKKDHNDEQGVMHNHQTFKYEKEKFMSRDFLQTMSSAALTEALSDINGVGSHNDEESEDSTANSDDESVADYWDRGFGIETVVFREIKPPQLVKDNNLSQNYVSRRDRSVDDDHSQVDIVPSHESDQESSKEQSEHSFFSESTDETSNFIVDGVEPITDGENNISETYIELTDEHKFEEPNAQGDSITENDIPREEKPLKGCRSGDIHTFEELVEKTLISEKVDSSHGVKENPKAISKRPYLRKGHGLARFSGKLSSKAFKMPTNIANYKSTINKEVPIAKQTLKLIKPKAKISQIKIADGDSFTREKQHIHQEIPDTNVINKANDCKQSHNQVNTMKFTKEISEEKFGKPVIRMANNINLKNKTRSEKWETVSDIAIDSSIDASFQQMMIRRDRDGRVEKEELEEFELLEEAALANLSIASSTSGAIKFLNKQRRTLSGAPDNSQSTPKIKVYSPSYPLDDEENDLDDTEDAEQTVIEQPVDNVGNDLLFNDGCAWDQSLDTTSEDTMLDETIKEACSNNGNTWHLKKEIEKGSQTSSPHTTALMKQIFPGLNEPKTKSSNPEGNDAMTASPNKKINSDETKPQLLQSKLQELTEEINKFKAENSVLENLRVQRELELKKLREEIESFQRQKNDELERIEKHRDEEMRKLRHERKLFDKYQKAARAAPNKQEREEIERLKTQVSDLQEQLRVRESRWNSASHRFRTKIEELEQDNLSLKEEVKHFERDRLNRWARKDKSEINYESKVTTKKTGNVSSGQGSNSNMTTTETANNSGSKVDFRVKKKVQSKIRDSSRHGKSASNTLEEQPRNNVLPEQPPSVPSEEEKSLKDRLSDQSKELLALNDDNKKPENGTREMLANTNKEIRHTDGKVEKILENGSKEITFPNGTRKNISSDGTFVVVSFFNGDIKQVFPDQKIVYYYSESKTTHSTLPDGNEILEFPNGQVEKHFVDGTKEIIFPDETVKSMYPNGVEETVFPDGTTQRLEPDGVKTVTFANGQKEIHTEQFKRREYPDGTTKTVYQDGHQETRYSSGRVRVKDKDGTVLVDTGLF